MQALEFDFEWEAANGIKGAELACTWASLRVRVNNWGLYTILTKATNFHFIAIGYRRLDFRPVRWM